MVNTQASPVMNLSVFDPTAIVLAVRSTAESVNTSAAVPVPEPIVARPRKSGTLKVVLPSPEPQVVEIAENSAE